MNRAQHPPQQHVTKGTCLGIVPDGGRKRGRKRQSAAGGEGLRSKALEGAAAMASAVGAERVKAALDELFGSKGDATIIDYICGVVGGLVMHG